MGISPEKSECLKTAFSTHQITHLKGKSWWTTKWISGLSWNSQMKPDAYRFVDGNCDWVTKTWLPAWKMEESSLQSQQRPRNRYTSASIHLFIYLSVSPLINQSINQPTKQSIKSNQINQASKQSINQSINQINQSNQFICLAIYLSSYLSTHLFIYPLVI